MAIFNEILAGRWPRALQKLFNMKGGPPTRALAGELTPVVAMFYGSECRFLEGWNRFGLRFVIPAGGAGNGPGMMLRNPLTSGVIAVIEKCIVDNTSGAAANFIANLGVNLASDEATVLNPQRLDGRLQKGAATPLSSLVTSQTGATPFFSPAGMLDIWSATALNGTDVDVIVTDFQELTLTPGDGFAVRAAAVNVTMEVSVWWRERALEDSEKQG